MNHQTLRNAGLTGISALALTLVACGGSSSTSTPAAPANQAPKINAVSATGNFTQLVSKHTYAYTIAAFDQENDTLSFTATPSAGVQIQGTTLLYTPAAAGAASSIKLVANDGKNNSAEFPVNFPAVVADTAPTAVAVPNMSAETVQNVSLPGTDVDGDTYSYAIVTGGTLPAGKATLNGNVLSISAVGVTPGDYTIKVDATQKFNGATIGTATALTLNVKVVTMLNNAPNFVGVQPVNALKGRERQVMKLGADVKASTTLTATDAEGHRYSYSLAFVNPAVVKNEYRFFSTAAAAQAFVDGLAGGTTPVAVGTAAGEIPFNDTAYNAAKAVTSNNTPLDIFVVPMKMTQDAVENVEMRVIATDEFGAVDPKGTVYTATFDVDANLAPVIPSPDATTGIVGVATKVPVDVFDPAAPKSVIEGTAVELNWNADSDTVGPDTTNFITDGDGDYAVTLTLTPVEAATATVGGKPVTLKAAVNPATLSVVTLPNGTTATKFSWLPDNSEAFTTKQWKLTAYDKTGVMTEKTITLAVNGVVNLVYGKRTTVDVGTNVDRSYVSAPSATLNAGAVDAGAIVVTGFTPGADNATVATFGTAVSSDAIADTADLTKFFVNTATGVVGSKRHLVTFANDSVNLIEATIKNAAPGANEMDLNSYGVTREALAGKTALTPDAVLNNGTKAGAYMVFSATGLKSWNEDNHTFGIFVPNLNESGFFGKIATTKGAQLQAQAAPDAVSNFPKALDVVGSDVTLDWASLPGTQRSALVTTGTTDTAKKLDGTASNDADRFYIAQMEYTAKPVAPAIAGAAVSDFAYFKPVKGVEVAAKDLADGNFLNLGVLSFTEGVATSIPVNLNRLSFYELGASVHGGANQVTFSGDTFRIFGTLDAANGPVASYAGAPFLFNQEDTKTAAAGETAVSFTASAQNVFGAMAMIRHYNYSFAVAIPKAMGTANALGTTGAIGSFEPFVATDTAALSVKVAPVLHPFFHQGAAPAGVDMNPFNAIGTDKSVAVTGANPSILTWEINGVNGVFKKAEELSGAVVEFFALTDANPIGIAAAPVKRITVAYDNVTAGKVRVDIPGGTLAAGSYMVKITQIRTERDGKLVNFGLAPFTKGYPYHYAETVGVLKVN